MMIDDQTYKLQLASDVIGDGMALELLDGEPPAGAVIADVYYNDASGAFTFQQYVPTVPNAAIAWLRAESLLRLPPEAHTRYTVSVTGWERGFRKVACTDSLRTALSLDLPLAKGVTDRILANEAVELPGVSQEAAERLALMLCALGARAQVKVHAPAV